MTTSTLRHRSHQLHGSPDACTSADGKPSSSRPISESAADHKSTYTYTSRSVAVLFSLVVVIGTVIVILWSSSARNAGHSHSSTSTTKGDDRRTRRQPSSSVFDSCIDPSRRKRSWGDAPSEVNQAPCAYFRPALLLDPTSPNPHPIAKSNAVELQRTFEEINVKWLVYAFQAANFGSEWDGPRLGFGQQSQSQSHAVVQDGETTTNERYKYASLASYVESVAILAAPKCGSRSLYQLFLSNIASPSKRIPLKSRDGKPVGRVGRVDAKFVEELERRQREDGVVSAVESADRGVFAQLAQLFSSSSRSMVMSSSIASPPMRRRDVVLSVVRDPIPRFLSSVTQLMSMMGTKRCDGCTENLEPCVAVVAGASNKDDLDPNQVLQCVARSIAQHGFWNEHLVPWVHFVRTPLAGHDVEVAVFPMEEMGTFMEEFGVVEGSTSTSSIGVTNTNNKVGARRMEGGGGVRKGNDGVQGARRPPRDEPTGKEGLHFNKFDEKKFMTEQGEELRGLVYGIQGLVSNNQLSEPLREQLCRLYAVDVDVMRYLGFQVGYC